MGFKRESVSFLKEIYNKNIWLISPKEIVHEKYGKYIARYLKSKN